MKNNTLLELAKSTKNYKERDTKKLIRIYIK
jgi:hypothetical protein